MGSLARVGGLTFTKADYLARKKWALENIDERKEYAVGDVIHCNYCGRVKSLDMPERNFYINAHCDCLDAKAQQEKAHAERLERIKKYKEYNERSLPTEVRNATFYRIVDKDSSEEYLTVCERCEKFCRNFQAVKKSGRGIWLYGEFDTGKSYLAAAILKTLQSEGVPAIFTTLGRIMEELKASYNSANGNGLTEQGVMGLYSGVDCLIIDGFQGIKSSKRGAESWTADRFCEIIQRRCDNNLPTVITCRSSIKELASNSMLPWGIVDRLASKMVVMQLTDCQRKIQAELEF